MSLKTQVCIIIRCDEPNCGQGLLDEDSAYHTKLAHIEPTDIDRAVKLLERHDWTVAGEKHYCDEHDERLSE